MPGQKQTYLTAQEQEIPSLGVQNHHRIELYTPEEYGMPWDDNKD